MFLLNVAIGVVQGFTNQKQKQDFKWVLLQLRLWVLPHLVLGAGAACSVGAAAACDLQECMHGGRPTGRQVAGIGVNKQACKASTVGDANVASSCPPTRRDDDW